MCDSKNLCQFPERLKGKVGECSPEQVKECHGKKPGCEPKKQDPSGQKFHADGSVCTCGADEDPEKQGTL